MNLSTGVDLIEISRIQDAITRHGDHFLNRIFTEVELAVCKNRIESLAGRFAAKEACAKALGTGIGDVSWKEIEIAGDENNAPTLKLYGQAGKIAKQKGFSVWSASISHTADHAIAFVTMIG